MFVHWHSSYANTQAEYNSSIPMHQLDSAALLQTYKRMKQIKIVLCLPMSSFFNCPDRGICNINYQGSCIIWLNICHLLIVLPTYTEIVEPRGEYCKSGKPFFYY